MNMLPAVIFAPALAVVVDSAPTGKLPSNMARSILNDQAQFTERIDRNGVANTVNFVRDKNTGVLSLTALTKS